MPAFFIPATDINLPADPEDAYAFLASFGLSVPAPPAERIYQVEFDNEGHWTATVGHQLSGVKIRMGTHRGRRVEKREHLSSSSTVLAIFTGAPIMVVTDARPLSTRASRWANPFMATNDCSQVVYFD